MDSVKRPIDANGHNARTTRSASIPNWVSLIGVASRFKALSRSMGSNTAHIFCSHFGVKPFRPLHP
jgi:hypothetical protein